MFFYFINILYIKNIFIMNIGQYFFGENSTLKIGGTLIPTGRYPIQGCREWKTLSNLETFILDASPSAAAFPGMIVSVVEDSDESNNGAYMIFKVGAAAADENDNTKCSEGAYKKIAFLGEGGGTADLSEIQETIEEMDYVYSLGLTDLDYRLSLIDYDGLTNTIIENEKTTAKAISYLNDRIDELGGGSSNITYGSFPDGENQKVAGAASVDGTIDYISYYLNGQKGSFSNLTDSDDTNDVAKSGWADAAETELFINSIKSDILSTISDNELITSSALNDLNVRVYGLDSSALKNDINGNIKSKGLEDSNYIGATEDIALGVGVFADKRRSFGWGNSYQGLFLSGSDNYYTVTLQNLDGDLGHNQVLEAFSIACVGGHILASGTTHERVATIVDAVYDSSEPSVTIETDIDLGVLSNKKFTYESKTGEMNFCAGNFMVSGQQNVVLGTSQFVTQGLSVSIGLMNAQGGLNGTIIGCHNNNKVTGGVLLGVGNTLDGKSYSGAFGKYNNVISNGTIPSYAVGYKNIIDAGYGVAVGTENTVSTNLGYVIGAANEILYPGVTLGFYSKVYESDDNSEKNLFVVGNGTNYNNRRNSIEQKHNGDLYIAGVGSFDGTNSSSNAVDSLQTVISKLVARIAALEALHSNE